jgi:hypothetical protein
MAGNAVNDRVADAVAQLSEAVGGASVSQARAMADQLMAHAIALAMPSESLWIFQTL